jgi:8-oxo-dGTP diphosphatase
MTVGRNRADRRDRRARAIVDVHIILRHQGRVLLGRRAGTGFADGFWHLPAGHVEEDEPLPEAAAREAKEELSIHVAVDALELVHVMQQPGRVAAFFVGLRWRGSVENNEPHKCAELAWFDRSELPADVTPYCRAALDAIEAGLPFSTFGWSNNTTDKAA